MLTGFENRRLRVQNLFEVGKSVEQITELTGESKQYVVKWSDRFASQLGYKSKRKSGRPKLLTMGRRATLACWFDGKKYKIVTNPSERQWTRSNKNLVLNCREKLYDILARDGFDE